ncbi:family 1 encapsulin nanocompartment shell protein [Microbacterium azadirachtae]|jgi:uncharacterized linocin/CFP29 family protein|uniref:Type 1 encapsulin shell protein n=1 Tax=Microbacterium azadirachtae TaxID=582680 RepID=A0A1I6HS04_9MICO|nr:family 1 encapsulin nanocompartment shell protein [Microbacterium azadirachtae]SFR57215.1 Uncharacterized protein, linocin/CFP29 family [Microbacterium azadirachtae]
MDNLHRRLAPISSAAWDQIDDEARRTFITRIAGRRVVDVPEAGGSGLSAIGTGHLEPIAAPAPSVEARRRQVQPLVELRALFTVTHAAVDDVERGAQDSDWQPVKDAVEALATAEDTLVFAGSEAAGVQGIIASSSNDTIPLPADPRELPAAVARALTVLRTVGVQGPYALLLSAELYTAASETVDHGYPVAEHLRRLLGDDGTIVFAPALDGAIVLTMRGGDYALTLGQDVSIGYLSHDAEGIRLYAQESVTFSAYTSEASVILG